MADEFQLTVVVPCLNEESNIAAMAERLFGAVDPGGPVTELLFVDDGSVDRTWDLILEQRTVFGDRVVGVRHEQNRGIAESWRTGARSARGQYLCLIDGDLQNPPEEVPKLYRKLLESPHDIVQGTRSSIGRLRDSRLFLSRALNLLLTCTFGKRGRDIKSGFLLGPRRVIEHILAHDFRYRYFQTFVAVSARAKGYSILEVETLFDNRNAGSSFISANWLRVSWEALKDMVPAAIEFRLQGRSPSRTEISPRYGAPKQRGVHPYGGWRRLWFELYFLTMPLHKWLITRQTRGLYLELRDTQWLSADRLRALQLRKLGRLVQHAYNHVPYYRQAMSEAGVHPNEVTSLEDLVRLPMLSKDSVRRNLYFDLFADTHRKRWMQKIATSGSTGEPFTVYADRQQLQMRFATTLRALEWTGWRFGDRQVRLWHQTIGMTRLQTVRERLDALFMRRLFIPAFELTPTNLERMLDRISAHRPVLVDGYAESLNFLASYIREGGKAVFSPKAVMSSAQALSAATKRLIEEEFRTRVFDKYGSREFSGIAYQCGESDYYHVMDESYLVEIVVEGRPALPGEVGEIVITDLNNFSMPLIRYRIGDLAVAADESTRCECGRELSRIDKIQGRTQAIVHCGNGVWLPGAFFGHFFKDYEFAIRLYQIVQTRKGEFQLRIVKNRQFEDRTFERLMAELRSYVGAETLIDIQFVDEIPLLATGKRTPVISTVVEDFQALTPTRHVDGHNG